MELSLPVSGRPFIDGLVMIDSTYMGKYINFYVKQNESCFVTLSLYVIFQLEASEFCP